MRKREEKEDGKKLRYMEMEKGGRREGGRGKSVCVVWCKPWVLVDGWM